MSPFQRRIAALLRAGVQSSPEGRPPHDEPAAAVALVLAPDPDAILLIRRADHPEDPWSGQMALPGGRRDGDDPDLLATAVRETLEEVGLDLRAAPVLGALPDVTPRSASTPPFMVRPFVFALDRRPPLALNPEVAATRWVEVSLLRDPAVRQSVPLTVRGVRRVFPAYVLGPDVVWGMTERVLTPLLNDVVDGEDFGQ